MTNMKNIKGLLVILAVLLILNSCGLYNNDIVENEIEATVEIGEDTKIDSKSSELVYDGEAIFYCKPYSKYGYDYEDLKFGYYSDFESMLVTIDGYVYDETNEYIVLLSEHTNTLIDSLQILLFISDEVVKQYNFSDVVFYDAGLDTDLNGLDEIYDTVRYAWIAGRGGIANIDAIGDFKDLELLYIDDFDLKSSEFSIKSIDVLAELKNLKHLYFFGDVPLDILDLEKLDNLSSLALYKTSGFDNIDFLKHFSNLEYLKIHGYTGNNGDLLVGLDKLRYLEITSCNNIETLIADENLESIKLKDLRLANCNMITYLPQMPNLKSIELYRCDNIKNLDCLATISSMEDIELSYLSSLMAIPSLNKMLLLDKLILKDLPNVSGELDISEQSSINYLNISDCNLNIYKALSLNALREVTLNLTMDYNKIKYSGNIEKLYISSQSHEALDLNIISEIEGLVTLEIDAASYTNLKNLQTNKKLKNLIVRGNLSEQNLLDLAHIEGLEHLSLDTGFSQGYEVCNVVQDIAFLKDLENLKYLKIEIGEEIEDYAPLAKLKNLEILIISGDNLLIPEEIGDLVHLHHIEISNSGSVYSDCISNLGVLENLKELYVYDLIVYNDTDVGYLDISFIVNLINLEVLLLDNGTTSYLEFPDLSNLKALRSITFNNVGNTNIDGIWNARNLEELCLSNAKIEDITDIKDLSELKKLILISNNIEDYSPILALKKLEYLEISGYGKGLDEFNRVEGLVFKYY